MTSKAVALSVGVLLSLSTLILGCATARTVSLKPGKGGVVAVNMRNSEEARGKARMIMSDNCGGDNYQIVEEGEAVVGTTTQHSSSEYKNDKKSSWGADSNMYGSSYSTQQTEWRLTYECGKAASAK